MKIIVADDHALFCEGLRHILRRLADTVEIMEAANYDQAAKLLQQHQDADLAIIDLSMPGRQPLTGLNELLSLSKTIPIVVLSGSDDVDDIRQVLNVGALGFIPKRESADVMLSALRLVLSGGIYIPPMLMNGGGTSTRNNATLTPRQLDVLQLMCAGHANKEIGRELGLSEATVKAHITAIFRVLNVRNRTQAVRSAEHLGILH